jgi:hypothetical protein
MPNWCSNILEASGPEEEVCRFLEETGPVLSFDRIIPMPEELRDTVSPPRPPYNAGTHALTLWQQRQAELLKKYGAADWYDWAVQNWGTKWDADAVQQEECGYSFDTAWSPPFPVIAALAAKYSKLRFSLIFGEPGMYFGGQVAYQNGALIEETIIPDDELPAFFEEMFGWEQDDEEDVDFDPELWSGYFRAALARLDETLAR